MSDKVRGQNLYTHASVESNMSGKVIGQIFTHFFYLSMSLPMLNLVSIRFYIKDELQTLSNVWVIQTKCVAFKYNNGRT